MQSPHQILICLFFWKISFVIHDPLTAYNKVLLKPPLWISSNLFSIMSWISKSAPNSLFKWWASSKISISGFFEDSKIYNADFSENSKFPSKPASYILAFPFKPFIFIFQLRFNYHFNYSTSHNPSSLIWTTL